MKTYIIGNLILAPFVLAAYLFRQDSPALSSVILTIGFGFSVSYLFKNINSATIYSALKNANPAPFSALPAPAAPPGRGTTGRPGGNGICPVRGTAPDLPASHTLSPSLHCRDRGGYRRIRAWRGPAA